MRRELHRHLHLTVDPLGTAKQDIQRFQADLVSTAVVTGGAPSLQSGGLNNDHLDLDGAQRLDGVRFPVFTTTTGSVADLLIPSPFEKDVAATLTDGGRALAVH
jgi:hypothetical protein